MQLEKSNSSNIKGRNKNTNGEHKEAEEHKKQQEDICGHGCHRDSVKKRLVWILLLEILYNGIYNNVDLLRARYPKTQR